MLDRGDYRRHLPHYQNANKDYFITFVTLGWWILPPPARDIAINEIVALHNKMAFIYVAVVMPDHVHIVMKPLWDSFGFTYPLPTMLKTVKGRSARFINHAIRRHGRVWLDESFDHELRSDESLDEKIEYVLQNPVRKKISRTPDEYPWIWRWWVEGQKTTG
jgi:putative transposase